VMRSVKTFPEGTHSFQPHKYTSPSPAHVEVNSTAMLLLNR
jgi:hypothetical protein